MPETDTKRAMEKCYRLLSYRSRTEYEIADRLERAGFAAPAIKFALAKLKEFKLLDDESFAINWVKRRLSNKPVGAAYLKAELQQKGVDGEIIARVICDYNEEEEFNAAMRLVKKKLAAGSAPKNWRRLAGFLVRRGFASSVIHRVYRTLNEDGRLDIS